MSSNELLTKISRFMETKEALELLELSTASRLVAVEGLTTKLLNKFGDEVKENNIKQQIGKYARTIMERNGYRIEQQNVRTRNTQVFTSGTRYIK